MSPLGYFMGYLMLNRILREPLFHFLLLGALMFAAYLAMQDNRNYHPPGSIAVTPGRIQQMTVAFETANGHKPSPEELDAVIASYIRDEVLVRQALKLGLDQDDPTIRATLIEKVRGLAGFGLDATDPTDADLQAYLAANPGSFLKDGILPPLAEIRDAVKAAYGDARMKAAEDAYFEKAKADYLIEITMPELKS